MGFHWGMDRSLPPIIPVKIQGGFILVEKYASILEILSSGCLDDEFTDRVGRIEGIGMGFQGAEVRAELIRNGEIHQGKMEAVGDGGAFAGFAVEPVGFEREAGFDRVDRIGWEVVNCFHRATYTAPVTDCVTVKSVSFHVDIFTSQDR